MTSYFQDTRIASQIQAIREFCQKPAQRSGGILLIAGPRGSGKTRLVDYALNEEKPKLATSIKNQYKIKTGLTCLLYTSPSPRD